MPTRARGCPVRGPATDSSAGRDPGRANPEEGGPLSGTGAEREGDASPGVRIRRRRRQMQDDASVAEPTTWAPSLSNRSRSPVRPRDDAAIRERRRVVRGQRSGDDCPYTVGQLFDATPGLLGEDRALRRRGEGAPGAHGRRRRHPQQVRTARAGPGEKVAARRRTYRVLTVHMTRFTGERHGRL